MKYYWISLMLFFVSVLSTAQTDPFGYKCGYPANHIFYWITTNAASNITQNTASISMIFEGIRNANNYIYIKNYCCGFIYMSKENYQNSPLDVANGKFDPLTITTCNFPSDFSSINYPYTISAGTYTVILCSVPNNDSYALNSVLNSQQPVISLSNLQAGTEYLGRSFVFFERYPKTGLCTCYGNTISFNTGYVGNTNTAFFAKQNEVYLTDLSGQRCVTKTVCSGGNFTVNGQSVVTTDGNGNALTLDQSYQWQIKNSDGNWLDLNGQTDDTLTINASSTLNVTKTTSVSYRRVTTIDGLGNFLSNNVEVEFLVPQISISNNTNGSINAGTTVQLTASGGSSSSYTWNTGATSQSISVSPRTNTTYTVTGLSNGCSNTATITVVVTGVTCTSAQTPTVTATSTSVCSGSSTTLNLSGNLGGAANWQWYADNSFAKTIGSGTSITVAPTVSTSSSLTYFVRAEGGCLPMPGSSGSLSVSVNAAYSPMITPSFSISSGSNNIILTITSPPQGYTFTWTGQGINGTVTGTKYTVTSPSSISVYTVTATNSAIACVSTATISTGPLPAITNPSCGSTLTKDQPITFSTYPATTSYTIIAKTAAGVTVASTTVKTTNGATSGSFILNDKNFKNLQANTAYSIEVLPYAPDSHGRGSSRSGGPTCTLTSAP